MSITRAEFPPTTAVEFSSAELSCFHDEGFAIVRNLVSESARQEMLDLTKRQLDEEVAPVEFESELHYPGAPESLEAEGGRTVRRLKQAHSRHPIFSTWLSEPSVVRRLHQLLGDRVVMPLAHHNCIMTKQPRFSSDTLWHQDIRYWSYQRPDLISLWIALGEERPENGCLYVIPGTHRDPVSRDRLDEALFLRPELPQNADLIAHKIPVELNAGDVLFFHCRTFHAASKNHTQCPKFSAVFTFRPIDNEPLPGSRSASMPEILLPRP